MMKEDTFGDILRSLFTFWNDPNLEEYIEKGKNFDDMSKVRIGKCGDLHIFLVNGDIVKTKSFQDFVEGGNDAVYGKEGGEVANFMPKNEIWIDANADINSLPYICFHELWERYQMTEHKLHYEDAHDKANAIEMKLRKLKAFETKRNVLLFPRIKQPDGNTCGHTSIAMILEYFGTDKTIEEIEEIVKSIGKQNENSEGLSPETIVNVFSKLNVKSYIKNDLSFDEIKAYINTRVPLIIEMQAWVDDPNKDLSNEWGDGHYNIAIGYTLDYVIFADPYSFYKAYIKYDDLLPRWHDNDYGKKNEKLAIIVEPPNDLIFEREKAIPIK